jgi:hypothetical protein
VTSLSKRATASGVFATVHANDSGVFDHYKFTHPPLSSSHKHNTKYLSYKYLNFSFFQLISDLNFDHFDEENYTAGEPSGSNFFAGIFSNFDQSNSYPNQV